MKSTKKIQKLLLMQPNYSIFQKRSWDMIPYNLALLNACLPSSVDTVIFDPNFENMGEDEIRHEIRNHDPDVVGVTSCSTEYVEEIEWHTALIRQEVPDAIIILGGVLPTVLIERAIQDENVDYFVMGEGERRFTKLLDALAGNGKSVADLDGIAYRSNGANVINPPTYFHDDLDALPFPDYGNLDIRKYGNRTVKYAHHFIPRHYPFAVSITSRGCPYKCIFCAGRTMSGTKVRMRSAENVLHELDWLCADYGIQEMIYLDDHFLFNKNRAIDIMTGIIERKYPITWKCGNVAVFALDKQILDLKRRSGCYQVTISIESGVQEVLSRIIKKPVNLQKAKEVVGYAKSLGFEVASNFIIGFPQETWDQIRRTIEFAESLDIDMVNFHIATPLPKTKLMESCIERGLIRPQDSFLGYTKAMISTSEFTAMELEILRAFEWDRINFKSPQRVETIARMQGLTVEQATKWRTRTRKNLGTILDWQR